MALTLALTLATAVAPSTILSLDLIGVPGAMMSGATGVGFAIPAETIRTFLSEHCYESVWKPAAPDKKACEKDKLDKVNEIRVKAGLQPLEEPKEQDSLSGSDTVVHATHLDVEKPVAPVPANPPPQEAPTPSSRLISSIANFLDYLTGK